jgi:hypothetical protein
MAMKSRVAAWSLLVAGVAAVLFAITNIAAAADGAKTPAKALLAAAPRSGAPASPFAGTKDVTITDPVLNMKAYSFAVPANWIFEGTVIQGTPCVPGPFAVWRAFSPEGLTGMKALPRLDWAWSDDPQAPSQSNAGCLPYKKQMPASDVLKYMIGVLQVAYVKDEPVPWLADVQRKTAAQNTPRSTATADIAIATVRYHINKIEIEEQLKVFVGCNSFAWPRGAQHYCSAQVVRAWAPQGKWLADTYKGIERSFAIDQQWNAKWNAVMVQKIKDIYQAGTDRIVQAGKDADARMSAQQNAFDNSQKMRQQQHEDFMASMQRGTDMSMQRAAESANASHRAADDWCDYSLDLQKRYDPNTGLITKDSNAYNYTWVNDQGKRLQTNDPNDNPNGAGSGNWTLQENVR